MTSKNSLNSQKNGSDAPTDSNKIIGNYLLGKKHLKKINYFLLIKEEFLGREPLEK